VLTWPSDGKFAKTAAEKKGGEKGEKEENPRMVQMKSRPSPPRWLNGSGRELTTSSDCTRAGEEGGGRGGEEKKKKRNEIAGSLLATFCSLKTVVRTGKERKGEGKKRGEKDFPLD